jgi:hypothetical protein
MMQDSKAYVQGARHTLLEMVTRQAVYYKRNIEARSRNHYYCVKAINVEYSECVPVAKVIQHEMRVRRIVLSVLCDLSGCTTFFSTWFHKLQDVRGKVTEGKMCVLIFSTTFV